MKKILLFIVLAVGAIAADQLVGNLTFTSSIKAGTTTPATITGTNGALTLTGAGSNQNITLTPSGTGVVKTAANFQFTTSGAGFTSDTSDGSDNKFVSVGGGGGLAASRGAFMNFVGNEFATASAQGILELIAGFDSGFANANAGRISFTAGNSETTQITRFGTLSHGVSRTLSAWGVSGSLFRVGSVTSTDSSSSGTVATAVANSFAVPTFAASSATTFTNAANFYIAGDVANGTNVTLTNSYGLWNAGKTRLDGGVGIGQGGTANAALSILYTIGATTNGYGIINELISSGNQTNLIQQDIQHTVNNGVTIGTRYGFRILDSGGSGTITNDYGLYIAAHTKGGTLNRSLYVAGGRSEYAATNDATIAGDGAVILAGGFYAAKKIVSGTAVFDGSTANLTITGGAGNMTITAGTGNSRTLTLQTTTSGGTATNAVVFGATQAATFNGPIIQKVSALTYASPTSVDVTLGNVYTVTTVNATGSVTFNATAGGTAGQSMTIIITNDATSAKTITFGTNFVANGTLTASGAGKVTTITFMSNGTSFYETARVVLP